MPEEIILQVVVCLGVADFNLVDREILAWLWHGVN